jgi:hypothetical protein
MRSGLDRRPFPVKGGVPVRCFHGQVACRLVDLAALERECLICESSDAVLTELRCVSRTRKVFFIPNAAWLGGI